MNFDKLEIHIENFIPGLATVWAIALHWNFSILQNDLNKIALGTMLLGAIYLIGVIVNVFCRMVVDPISEGCTRYLIFKIFARKKLEGVKNATKDEINYAYNYYCEKAENSEKYKPEISKRRQTGRLLRSSLIPLLITVFHISKSNSFTLLTIIFSLIASYLALLILYGYAEVIILHEAYHAAPSDERSIKFTKTIRAR